MNIVRNKILGCLYGQAIGDALGLGTEFMCKSKIKNIYPDGLSRYEQIHQDSHRKRWEKGAWTDDTDMMLCILKAYDGQEFNINKVAENFKGWFNGAPMGIGNNTFKVLCMSDYVEQPELCSKIMWDISRHKSAANGALMRTSVVGIPKIRTEQQAETICKLTHYDPRCIGSCVIVSLIIHNLIWNNKQLSVDEIKHIGNHYDQRIGEWIDAAYISSDISSLELDKADSVGYTLRTLSAALWAYWHASSFEDGLLSVVNEGGDADTNAAVGCAILGAKFGYSSIPSYYIDNLQSKDIYKLIIEAFVSQIL
ncbi:MAG: ADP-ribosylglycohydrolase family protein [Muribaculaceae bacterium]|nr:ADP-ribosylglycohydrolase family protein [Muribaculaceae bacterium]